MTRTLSKIEINKRQVPLIAKVNRRAKKLILKVDAAAGEIHVTAPSQSAVPDAIAFAHERAEWIAQELRDELRAMPFAPGEKAPLRGVFHTLFNKGGPRAPVRIDEIGNMPAILVGGDEAHFNRRITDWLRRQALADLTENVDRHTHALGEEYRAIKVRDTKTRWGSCSNDRVLSFSWRLIMAPPPILDYVAAHEVAHLRHMNHSMAFWRTVATLVDDVRGAETWLRDHGANLFRFGGMRHAA